MKKFNLIALLFMALCTVSLSSCSKDDDEDVSPNVSRLTAGVWSGSAVFVNGQDVTTEFEERYEIDWNNYTTTFERDGTYSEEYDGDQLIDGTWMFENEERVIVFEENGGRDYQVVVSKLDDDELWYLQDGVEYRFGR